MHFRTCNRKSFFTTQILRLKNPHFYYYSFRRVYDSSHFYVQCSHRLKSNISLLRKYLQKILKHRQWSQCSFIQYNRLTWKCCVFSPSFCLHCSDMFQAVHFLLFVYSFLFPTVFDFFVFCVLVRCSLFVVQDSRKQSQPEWKLFKLQQIHFRIYTSSVPVMEFRVFIR